jgi:hypothetical protein
LYLYTSKIINAALPELQMIPWSLKWQIQKISTHTQLVPWCKNFD